MPKNKSKIGHMVSILDDELLFSWYHYTETYMSILCVHACHCVFSTIFSLQIDIDYEHQMTMNSVI